MIGDLLQVDGEIRVRLAEVEQVLGAGAWRPDPAPGQIFPDGDPRRAAGTDAGLPLVAAFPRLQCFLQLRLYFRLPVGHALNYTMASL